MSGFGHSSGFSNPVEDARRSDEANLHTEESDKDTRSRTVTQMGRATAIGIRAAAPRRHIMNSLAHAGSGEFDGEQRTRAQKRASHATSHAPFARRGVSRRHRHRILKDSPWRCKQDTGRAHTHRRREPNQTTERRPSGDRAATEQGDRAAAQQDRAAQNTVSERERATMRTRAHESARAQSGSLESVRKNLTCSRHSGKNQRAIQRAFTGDAEVVSTQRKYPVVHPPRRRSARLHIRAANLRYYLWA